MKSLLGQGSGSSTPFEIISKVRGQINLSHHTQKIRYIQNNVSPRLFIESQLNRYNEKKNHTGCVWATPCWLEGEETAGLTTR